VRRILSIIILISMTLHCASRLGILSHLYQQRHAIAYAIGVVAEMPIALCSSDYDFNDELLIPIEDMGESIPATLQQAPELQLFLVEALCFTPRFQFLYDHKADHDQHLTYLPPSFPVFHPPAIG
jgi:hypothetical protein